jgi:hypothetical protein
MKELESFKIKSRILGKGSRNHRLSIPIEVIRGMGWSHDEVEIEPDPDNNCLIIKNPNRPAVGFMGFHFNLQDLRWARNKKKYQQELKANMSPEAKAIMLSVNWDEVEDGGYWNVKYYHDVILELNKHPRKNKEKIKKLLKEAEDLSNYIEKHGGKKPDWMALIDKKLNIFIKKLFKQQKKTDS